jgi:alpha-galactosidase
MKAEHKRVSCILLFALVIFSAPLSFGSTLVIKFKDGSAVRYDTSQVSSITFVESGPSGPGMIKRDFLKPDKMVKKGAYALFAKVENMTLHGKSYPLYVLQHPGTEGPTEAIYYLGGSASHLTASVGIDQSMNPKDPIHRGATVEYLIYIDGRLAWKSGIIALKSPVKEVDVDLTGVNELRLVVTDGGDGNSWDWAIWADPVIQ